VIQDLLANHLLIDEGIRAPPESILVTNGCQEAMSILLAGLFDPGVDALLSGDPTYIGITGMAKILGIPVVPVRSDQDGVTIDGVTAAISQARDAGRRPRALYVIPDFNNPLGGSLTLETRHRLIELAAAENLLVFEDNPYGMFAYDGEPAPTLKSLDEPGVVAYLGTFSKTIFPGLRIGYLVADQPVEPEGCLLADQLAKVKSLNTVNTSPLLQAVVGGLLLEHGGSIRPLVEEKLGFYRANRDRMLARLEEALAGIPEARWNRPAGGFFLTLQLPFPFDEECLRECASRYGVICCPMTLFTLLEGRQREVRLSFSYVTAEEIDEGIERLARFVRDRLDSSGSRVAMPSAIGEPV
jgi:(S)-3,5-dihydroxyphenylglycine transaminase